MNTSKTTNQTDREIEAQFTALRKESPSSPIEWASWHRRLGENWAWYAVNNGGDGYGSACSAYSQAATKYDFLCMYKSAELCRFFAGKYAEYFSNLVNV